MALSLDFTGKHVFVFGGTTGIGFGVAENFCRHGANVSIASRRQANIDAAMAVLFLASPLADYSSGAPIPCDGGGAVESVKPMNESAGRITAENVRA